MRPYLSLIDTATNGRYDVTPLFSDRVAFAKLVLDLLAPFSGVAFDIVAGIDALGFILGAAMAATAGCGFLPIRKGGRLPGGSRSISFRDYTGGEKTLSLRRGLLRGREQVLMLDDWIETGAQMSAAIRLVQLEGAAIVGVTAINIDRNEGTEELLRLHRCHFVWSYDAASDA